VAIAFFDLDKTLLSVNSATLWVKRELREGTITKRDALRAAFWVALYELGFARMELVILRAVAQQRGRREREVIRQTLQFWRDEVAMTLRPGARDAVARHRAKGDLVFLLTSSTNYLAAPLADELQLDGFLANRFEVEDGAFTGRAVLPICYGQGKVEHARGIAAKVNIPLEECFFYTDSYSDLPMLLAVGHPVVVHPDPRLRRFALRRGWPVEDWDQRAALPASTTTPPVS
jgi:HAD superfamily hydrolase (TIGR01490 family)